MPYVRIWGIHNVERLITACEGANLPAPARRALSLLSDQLADTQRKIEALTADIRADARVNEAARRLQTIPGIGPITASALVSALSDISDFGSRRDLSAWLGLTQAAFFWWQGKAGAHLEDGQQVSAPAALSWSNGADQRAQAWSPG